MSDPSSDPGSLERLHDIVLPEPAPWWPPAPAWYLMAALVLVLVLGVAWSLYQRWRRNAYRRAGLAELQQLETRSAQPETLRALAELVKRVALAVYPRERVASLSGAEWLRFLDASGGTSDFSRGPGARLEAGYEPGGQRASPELFRTVRHWITHHRADCAC